MYYRYKTKGNRSGFLKYGVLLVLIAALSWVVVTYHEDLMFWKYSYNKLTMGIDKLEQKDIIDPEEKETAQFVKKIDEYVEDNPLNENAYYLHALLYTLLGEKSSGITFTTFVTKSDADSISPDSREYFFTALKSLKRGFAIDEHAVIPDDHILLLVKLYLYTLYYDNETMYEHMQDISSPDEIKGVENRRLYGFLKVLGGETAYGISYLRSRGKIKSAGEQLFLAGVFTRSEQYTDAIMAYKRILEDEITKEQEKTARLTLGEIYFAQALYNEALEQFSRLLLEYPDDIHIKSLMAKTYTELGNPDLAQTYM